MYTALDEFCGFGGSSQGLHKVPGLNVVAAANHAPIAIEVHELNFPDAHHYRGDITRADVTKWKRTDFFWSSPACPPWSNARGKRRDFDKSTQGLLFDYLTPKQLADAAAQAERRALMEEVPRYLRAMAERAEPVLVGVVENVVEVVHWDQFRRWRSEIEKIGYKTKVIALNSMHARGRQTHRAPQSRDRFYMAFWHVSLGRDPDFGKWLRPRAWCPQCEVEVDAVQVWKKTRAVMGRYRSQYAYRCPVRHRAASNLEPHFMPAAAAIDWSLPGQRIGDRDKPLALKTLARIEAGLRKYARDEHGQPLEFDGPGKYARQLAEQDVEDEPGPAWADDEEPFAEVVAEPFTLDAAGHTFERRPGVRTGSMSAPLTTQTTTATKAVLAPPMLAPAGGTWNETAQSVGEVMRTRTTRDSEAVVSPMLIPVEGRPGKAANTVADIMRTQTTRNETGVAVTPLVMRNNTARPSNGPDGGGYLSVPVERALGALTTAGHQSVITPPFIALLRNNSVTAPVVAALNTISTMGAHHGVTVPPFVAELRGGGSVARDVAEALATITASGNHHGLVVPQLTMAAWGAVYGYDTGLLRSLLDALPTQTTVQGDALLAGHGIPEVEDCLFRMLEPHEIARGMAFFSDYQVKGSKRDRVRGYGNAVTPPVAEALGCCLMECLTGEPIERDLAVAA